MNEQEAVTAPRKKIRRKSSTGAEPAPSKMYFNENTQAAIVEYQSSTSKRHKDKIFENEILPAFTKLIENLINIHKFTGLHDSHEDLKYGCINFLFETINKFDASRGTNAFSYFNVVAKNWLIIKTKQKSSYSRRNVSLDNAEALTTSDAQLIGEQQIAPPPDTSLDSAMFSANNIRTMYEIRSRLRSENELACVNAIITIFENINDLDLLNKGAVLVYMRELSGLSPKQMTTAMQTVKKHYKEIKVEESREDEEGWEEI